MTARSIDEVLDFLGGIDVHSIRYQQKKMHAIYEWALEHLGIDYRVGDHVRIMRCVVPGEDCPAKRNGWWHYREALAVGATATVTKIDFNDFWKYWGANIVLDREWSYIDDTGKRYWHGRWEDTPEGYEAPHEIDREMYPNGRRHTFAVRVEDLQKWPTDEEILNTVARIHMSGESQ